MDEAVEREITQLRALYRSDRDPDGRAFATLADAYRRAGEHERALELLDEGLARHPSFATGHVVAAWVHRDRGARDDAIASFRRVLELDEQNVVALNGLGRLLVATGAHQEAASLLNLASQLGYVTGSPPPSVADLAAREEAAGGAATAVADDEDVMEIGALTAEAEAVEGDAESGDEVVDIGALGEEDEEVLDIGALAAEEEDDEVLEIGALAGEPDEEVLEIGALAADEEEEEGVLEIGALAADDREDDEVLEIGALAGEPDEEVLDIGALAAEPEDEEIVGIDALAAEPEYEDEIVGIGALAADEEDADVLDIGALAADDAEDEEGVLEIGALAADEPEDEEVLEIGALAAAPEDEEVLEIGALAAEPEDEEIVGIGALAGEPDEDDVVEIGALGGEPEAEDDDEDEIVEIGALTAAADPDDEDILEIGALAGDPEPPVVAAGPEFLEASEPAAASPDPFHVPEPASPEPEAAPPAPAGAGGPRTRTMAELYVRQGLLDRAIEVYEHLARQAPQDEELSARLAELRERSSGAAPAPPVQTPPPLSPEQEMEEAARDMAESGHHEVEPSPFSWADAQEGDAGDIADAGPVADQGEPVSSYLGSVLAWEPEESAGAPTEDDADEEDVIDAAAFGESDRDARMDDDYVAAGDEMGEVEIGGLSLDLPGGDESAEDDAVDLGSLAPDEEPRGGA